MRSFGDWCSIDEKKPQDRGVLQDEENSSCAGGGLPNGPLGRNDQEPKVPFLTTREERAKVPFPDNGAVPCTAQQQWTSTSALHG